MAGLARRRGQPLRFGQLACLERVQSSTQLCLVLGKLCTLLCHISIQHCSLMLRCFVLLLLALQAYSLLCRKTSVARRLLFKLCGLRR